MELAVNRLFYHRVASSIHSAVNSNRARKRLTGALVEFLRSRVRAFLISLKHA